MSVISACAAASVTAGFRRATTRRLCAVRPEVSALDSRGNHTSAPGGYMNPSGMTPTTLALRPSTTSDRAVRSGRPPSTRCHRPWPTTTAGVPFSRASSSTKVRPMVGATPSAAKNSRVTPWTPVITGSLPPVTVARPPFHAARAEKLVAACCQSRKFGADTPMARDRSVASQTVTT